MAQLIKGTPIPAQHVEDLFFMDKYGKEYHVTLAMTAGPGRADKVAGMIAKMIIAEDAVDAYYLANGHDTTRDLAAGAAAVNAALTASTFVA
jgi:hypothetical protein